MKHKFLKLYIMNKIERKILKLFINEYYNIDDISIKLNISEQEIIKILDKYHETIKNYSIQNLLVI